MDIILKEVPQLNFFFSCNWNTLRYFVSSRETVFSMKLMEQFDANILLGQQSFKQCADVYNYLNRHVSRYVVEMKALCESQEIIICDLL